jgi:hypothetical protein
MAELITAWPLLSPDLRVAILAIVRSADVPRLSEHQFPPPLSEVRTWRVERRGWGGETRGDYTDSRT